MRLLVISDSHGKLNNAEDVIEKLKKQIHAVIHLGDYIDDARKLERKFSGVDFYYVAGNNDYNEDETYFKVLNFGGKNILITHGHKEKVQTRLLTLEYLALENNAKAVLFGHTHTPLINCESEILIVNPGSISRPRNYHSASFAIVDINSNGLKSMIFDYKKDETYGF